MNVTSIKCALYLFTFFFICFSYSVPSAEEPNPITVVNSKGNHVEFPHYFATLSPVISQKQANEEEQGVVTLPEISSEVTVLLQRLVNHLATAARDESGKPVEACDINEKTIFVNSVVRSIVSSEIRGSGLSRILHPHSHPYSPQLLGQLLQTVCDLKISSLSNALAHAIVAQLHRVDGRTIEEQLVAKGFGALGNKPLAYIVKQINLIRHHREEFTVADYIGVHGQPNVDRNGILLRRKKLTGIAGLNHIHVRGTLHFVDLSNNVILGSDMDPDFPPQPFKTFSSLRELVLSHNLLAEIPASMFNGLSQLTQIFLYENEIRVLPNNCLKELPSLHYLSIGQNWLQESEEQFKRTHRLDYRTCLSYNPQKKAEHK